jgi:hypothetical protein
VNVSLTSHSSRTNNSWLFAPSSLILANHYLPLNGALAVKGSSVEKILFSLNVEDNWPPFGAEGVWCEKVGENFKLKNAPFFIPKLAANDVFSAELDSVNQQVYDFTVIEESGHSVIWVMNNKNIEISLFEKELISLGCSIEGIKKCSLFSIDVPVSLDICALNKLVDTFESKGLDFAFPVWRHGK